MTDRNRPLYMISVAAELAGVHPQTLRTYEQKGLVTPQRTSGNTRMYSQADIERLELINELTGEGINLAGVTRILDLQGTLEERDSELDELHKKTFELAQSADWSGTNQQLIDVVLIGRFMERLGDHAVSAAPRVVYIVSGFDPSKEPTRDEDTDIA